MDLKDIGPNPQAFNIDEATRGNQNYRTTAWSGKYLQVTLMSIPVGGEIGLEVHPETDQFLRVESGSGLAVMGDAEDSLDYQQELEDDWIVVVPAGKWHNVTNTGDEPLKLYSIYAPAHHKPGKVHPTKQDSDDDTDDEPADWSVQPD